MYVPTYLSVFFLNYCLGIYAADKLVKTSKITRVNVFIKKFTVYKIDISNFVYWKLLSTFEVLKSFYIKRKNIIMYNNYCNNKMSRYFTVKIIIIIIYIYIFYLMYLPI